MSIDSTSVGYKTQPHVFDYDWKTVVLYALGIGARREELDYLYEGKGPLVFPTFAVVPAYDPIGECLARTAVDLSQIVHSAQTVVVHRPIPAAARLVTTGEIRILYDMKRLTQIVLATVSMLDGELVCETEMTILARGVGGFGGPRPPKSDAPDLPEGRAPDFVHAEPTLPEQALLYRLSGDLNPLHADPEFAARVGFVDGPILHGLCTYGFLARAIAKGACGGDATRLRRLSAQFRKPIWPGEQLRTEGYVLGDGRVVATAFAADRTEPIVTNCWAEIAG
jgi:acyl dehydratase